MTIDNYPRLCGGTFFTLVLQDLRQRMNAREHYDGDCDGLTDPEVLVGLIRVINPSYSDPGKEKLKGIANNYKQGGNSKSIYFPFHDEQVLSAFDASVRHDYQTVLKRMVEFVNNFLDVDEIVHKDLNLVRALIDLIIQDKSTEHEEFYIGRNGEKKKRSELGGLQKVCFPSFLLGVWHFVVMNRKDNTVGKATYNKWCPPTGGGPREYTGDMGKNLLLPNSVYHISYASEHSDEPCDENPIEPDIIELSPESEGETTSSAGTQAVYNDHPIFISQQGDGNTVIPNYGTINLTIGKH